MPDLIFKSAHFWPSGEWRVNGLMGMTRFGCFLQHGCKPRHPANRTPMRP